MGNEKKTIKVIFRASKQERELLKQRASSEGKTVSQLCRELVYKKS